MSCIEIYGGHPLAGDVRIQGSKNAALPILAGTVLHEGTTILHNCPKISDVMYMVQILEEMGCRSYWSGHTLCIDASGIKEALVSAEPGEKMRSSTIFLGALLGRVGEAKIPYPGGCSIGARPIDLHINAMRSMGAVIEEGQGFLLARTKGLCGSRIPLRFPSVGATENIILAAVLARGRTEIRNAAREPEILELSSFLKDKGAKIAGAGTDTIIIEGVPKLQDNEYTLMPDRIVAGTYLMGVLSSRGSCLLREAPTDQLKEVLLAAEQMGAELTERPEGLYVDGKKAIKPLPDLKTAPYPGFPTDLQSQLMAVLCLAKGSSHIVESVFESRFKTADQLGKMGARIQVDGQEAKVCGVQKLTGARIFAPELRGGAALVIAGIAAEGRTIIEDCHYIQRGYEDISEDFRQLGATIQMK